MTMFTIKCRGCRAELLLSTERAPFCGTCMTGVSSRQLDEVFENYILDLRQRVSSMDAKQIARLDDHLTSIMSSSFMMRHLLRKSLLHRSNDKRATPAIEEMTYSTIV